MNRAGATGLSVVLSEHGRPTPVSPLVEPVAYRVVQECLTNAMKYAGLQGLAEVRLIWAQDRFEVVVHTVAGLPSMRRRGSGRGLAGLTARVSALGGRFTAGPTQAGFLSRAVLPVQPGLPGAASPATTGTGATA